VKRKYFFTIHLLLITPFSEKTVYNRPLLHVPTKFLNGQGEQCFSPFNNIISHVSYIEKWFF
jgi:hypothetical protein